MRNKVIGVGSLAAVAVALGAAAQTTVPGGTSMKRSLPFLPCRC